MDSEDLKLLNESIESAKPKEKRKKKEITAEDFDNLLIDVIKEAKEIRLNGGG